jgi:hypothetical protein
MNDSPPPNVVAFPGANQPQFTKAPLPATENDSSDSDMRAARVLAIHHFAEFLLKNADTIDNFVACVATKDEAVNISYKTFVSPITAADYSLALKMLEYAFLKSLEPEYFT